MIDQQPDGPQWDGKNRRDSGAWAFRREVSIGNLLTLALLAMPLMVWAISLDRRVALVETVLINQQRVDERQETDAVRSRTEIRAELQALNVKIDRILELRK